MRRSLLVVLSFVLLFTALTGCKRREEEIIPGLSWTMSDANPVLEPCNEPSTGLHGWYNGSVWFPWVIKEGSAFKMWFTGTNTENEDRIGYASNWNGEDWDYVHGTAVFEPGAPGSWDSGGVWNHCVIKDGAEYKMFYTGYENATGIDDRIGLAYSPDGLDWSNRETAPVLGAGPSGSWYEKALYSGTVIASGTTYQMWFSGVAADGIVTTGYTTSTDCIVWDTPIKVLDAGPDLYDSYMAFLPCVLFHENVYHMWYTGFGPGGYSLCYATSSDGINWGKHGVVRRDGIRGKWEDGYFVSACVVLDVTTFRMWYAAVNSGDGRARIGYGTSPAPHVP